MRSTERPSKQDAFLALLREGWTSLHLDARRPGVLVPQHLCSEAHLVLQYGYDLPIPIPDLEVDEHGVRATLSFSKSPLRTVVPWSAVYVVACDDGRGVLYHEDVPDDVSIIAARPPGDAAASDETFDSLDGLDPHSLADGPAADAASDDDPAGSHGGTHQANERISERLLRSIPADSAPADSPSAEVPQPLAARRRRRPQLRLVK